MCATGRRICCVHWLGEHKSIVCLRGGHNIKWSHNPVWNNRVLKSRLGDRFGRFVSCLVFWIEEKNVWNRCRKRSKMRYSTSRKEICIMTRNSNFLSFARWPRRWPWLWTGWRGWQQQVVIVHFSIINSTIKIYQKYRLSLVQKLSNYMSSTLNM